MDNVTHTLAGVAVANAFFRERYGKAAVPVLAVASNLPDIDGVVMLSGLFDKIALRRTFGHSLLLLPLWCGLLAWAFSRRYPDKPCGSLLGLVSLGVGAHLFLDLVNSFGVVLLWPLSSWRPELATTFIIDLTLTGVLAAPLLTLFSKDRQARLTSASRVSVALAAAYLLACGVLRQRAVSLLESDRAAAGRSASFSYVFPEPFGPHRWRGVEKDGGYWRLYLIEASGAVRPARELHDQAADPAAEAARASPLARRAAGFVKAPVWTVSALPDGTRRARERDLRFESLLLGRETPFVFEYKVAPDGTVTPGKPRI